MIATLIGHTNRVNALAILNSTQSIVSGSFDFTVKIWDSTTFQCIATLKNNEIASIDSNILSLAVLPNVESIFVGSNIQFEVWSFNEFSFLYLTGHADAVFDLGFLQNNRLISASLDQNIRNWDLPSGQIINVNYHKIKVRFWKMFLQKYLKNIFS